MANAQTIAREALTSLLKDGKDPTPEAYAEAYNICAKKLGGNVSEIDLSSEKILEMLDKEARDALFARKFKNKNELIATLVKAINLLFFAKKNFNTSLEILKILLRIISTHPQKEVANLAKGHLLEVDKMNANSMQSWRERWMEQVKKGVDSEILDLSRGLEILSSFRIPHLELQKWQDSIKDAIKTNTLNKNAQLKALVRLEEILKGLVAQIEKASLQKALESKEVKAAQKQESKKIKGYENAAMLPIDAVTTLIGKAGMQEVLNYAESSFKESGQNYSIIIFGITKYDKVKEIFGQEAAKKILMTLGRLLKQYSNSSDLIAYWGDEEFLACLLEREQEEAVKFICDLDLIVQKSVFMYQQTRIEIALSAQATHRVSESSLESMLKVSLDEFVKNKDTQGIICHKNLQ